MKILYFGENHSLYLSGQAPSHWLYGAVEMEQDGHEVIWEQESADKFNDLKLINRYKPDIIFIPNLNLHNHILLLTLAAAGFYRKPIYAYLHHEPKTKKGFKSSLYKFLIKGINHLFFLSSLTMQVTINAGVVDSERCSVPGWGSDLNFYSEIETSDSGVFVSTGKENRDFDTLIEAFRITGAPLHIMTAKKHGDLSYESLIEKCRDIPNIRVSILENRGANYPFMLKEMAAATALVCPLRQDRLNYCVGLSTVADAEALDKPLIITPNPYHDPDRMRNAYCASTIEDWVDAIMRIQNNKVHPKMSASSFNMGKAYEAMKKYICQL